MKKLWKFSIVSLLVISGLYLTGCDDDDNENVVAQPEETYTLDPISNSGVNGTVNFKKQNNETTIVTVQLSGTQSGDTHPAHIHSGSVGSGGPVVLSFTPVDGATGRSTTTVTRWDDGTAVTYEELIDFNGHVNVHLSPTELEVMIAQGDIGSNSSGNGN